MPYTIEIGNASIKYSAEDLWVSIVAEHAELDDAPVFNMQTGHSNSKCVAYSAWHNFTYNGGLDDLFFGKREGIYKGQCPEGFHREWALMSAHPGAQVLCPADLEFINAKRRQWAEKQGSGELPLRDYAGIDAGKDWVLETFIWLEFWVEWALKTCPIPVISNF